MTREEIKKKWKQGQFINVNQQKNINTGTQALMQSINTAQNVQARLNQMNLNNMQNNNMQNSKLQQARINQASNNVLMPKAQSTQPIVKAKTDLKELKPKNRLNNVAYVGKYAANEAVGALENTAQGTSYDILNYANKKDKRLDTAAVDAFKSSMNLANPVMGTANLLINNATEQAKAVKELFTGDRSVKEKLVDYLGNTLTNVKSNLPGFNQIMEFGNLAIEAEQAATGKNKQDIINRDIETTRNISKNYESRKEQYDQDLQVGQGTKTVGKVFGQVSRMLPTMATNAVLPGAGLIQMGQSAMGGTVNERLNQGDSFKDAVNRGNISEATEIATESMFEGLNKIGSGVVSKLPGAQKISAFGKRIIDKKIKSVFGKKAISYLGDVLGENAEELVSDAVEYLVATAKGEDANFNFSTEGETVLYTTATEIILGLLTKGMVGIGSTRSKSIVNNSNLDTTTKENLNKFIEDKGVTAQGANALVAGLNNIQNKSEINNILKEGNIQDVVDYIDKNQGVTMQNEQVLPQAQQTTQTEGNVAQNETSQEIRQDEELTEKTGQIVTNLMRSIDNYNNTRQEGEKVFDINDENTRKEIESIQKIAQDRGINITFDESRFDNSTDNAFYEYDDNGNVANIVLNPNSASKKYVQNLAVHELVHSFSGDKKSNLMNSVLDYAKTLEGYNKAYQDITNAYKSKYGNNVSKDVINEEVVANILGEKLGDKQFVDDMINGKYATQNRGFVERIYEFVKNQINRFRGYKDQEQYWKHVKELFDDAYKNSEINKGQSYSRDAAAMTNIKDSQGRNLSEGQVEYFKESKVRDKDGNLLEVYHGTPTRRIYNL